MKNAIFGHWGSCYTFWFLPVLHLMERMIMPFWKVFKSFIIRLIVVFLCYEVPEMKGLSADLKDLIKRILVPENQRISIDQILNHPWMTGKRNEVPLKLNFSKMKQFSEFSKVRFFLS